MDFAQPGTSSVNFYVYPHPSMSPSAYYPPVSFTKANVRECVNPPEYKLINLK